MLTKEARQWKDVQIQHLALKWKQDIFVIGKYYGAQVVYTFSRDTRDVDGSHKLALDVIAEVLGINDKRMRFLDLDKVLTAKPHCVGMNVKLYTSVD